MLPPRSMSHEEETRLHGDELAELLEGEEPTIRPPRPPRLPAEALRPPRMPSEFAREQEVIIPPAPSPSGFEYEFRVLERVVSIDRRLQVMERRFWVLCGVLVLADKVDAMVLLKALAKPFVE